jgi:proline dehydrogenase
MLSFNNTEIAFAHKSDSDLRRAQFLFKVIGNPGMVKVGKALTNFGLNLHLPIQGLIKSSIFKQFCGGETIAECTGTINELWKNHVGTILDYSIEGKTTAEDFEATTREIIATIAKGKGNPAIPFAVFKITGIGRFGILEKANDGIGKLTGEERKEYDTVYDRVNRICKAAHDSNVAVFIDAEESWIQDTIDTITHEMMELYNKERAIVYNTVQIYRHDRLAFLRSSVEWAQQKDIRYGVKLVRGAYMEKERARAAERGYPSPIQPDKASCDRDYDAGLDFVTDNLDRCALCAGTHNEDSSMYLSHLLEKKRISKDDRRVYFAQLLGMSDHISYNLADAGYNVAKYVPYGPVREVMPYLIRRANENTSVKGQTSRELGLINKELRRRKR